jgi:hypothetical protein
MEDDHPARPLARPDHPAAPRPLDAVDRLSAGRQQGTGQSTSKTGGSQDQQTNTTQRLHDPLSFLPPVRGLQPLLA